MTAAAPAAREAGGLAAFEVGTDHLLRNGARHQIISGALHYFRVPRELWADRLQRLVALGCNTVETYVAWNYHQPLAGTRADFSHDRDLGTFFDLAAAADLDVLVRPGPYICAEWDLGGLPSWLLADPRVAATLRTSDPAYLDHVDAWFDVVIPIVARRQISRGGRVIAIQVENEYGSYGNDTAYLEHLRDGLRERGIDVVLFTSDGPGQLWLQGGRVDGCWATVNFGSRQESAFAELARVQPDRPGMCMEFWSGWFDHWGGPHSTRRGSEATAELAAMLQAGRSVNLYMAHGGTSFGVWAGANAGTSGPHGTEYSPTVSSYDYDAPIREDGTLSERFWSFREVIARHRGVQPPPPPATAARQPPQVVPITDTVALSWVLDQQPSVPSPTPESFEALGLHHGVVRYRTVVRGPFDPATLYVDGLADLATVIVDGAVQARVGRTDIDPAFTRDAAVQLGRDSVVDVVVHSLGRVNFGPHLRDSKGMTSLRLEFQHQFGFEQTALDLTTLPALDWDGEPAQNGDQGFHRATVTLEQPLDTFVALPGWHHGYVFLNGRNLGRYWNTVGPQRTLYAPAPWWRSGDNELVILELGAVGGTGVELVDQPDLGPA